MKTIKVSICHALVFSLLSLFGGCQQLGELSTASKNVETTAKLKYIMLALDETKSEQKKYPDHLNKNHSWRVEIIDKIKNAELRQPFDKSQAWDSAANKAATESNVEAFTSLRSETQSSSFTNFVLVVDDGTVFNKTGVLEDDDIADGTSWTAVMLEVIDCDIHWSEPRDISIDEAIKLIQSFPEELEPRIGMIDTSVSSISPKASADEIRAIFLANDGKRSLDFW